MKWEYDVQLIEKVNQDLKEYDQIVLFPGDRRTGQNICTPAELPGQKLEDGILAKFRSFIRSQNRWNILVLSADKCKDLAGLYYTYEFSNKIRAVGGKHQHGSLMNYVALGLLTEQEMFEAILR